VFTIQWSSNSFHLFPSSHFFFAVVCRKEGPEGSNRASLPGQTDIERDEQGGWKNSENKVFVFLNEFAVGLLFFGCFIFLCLAFPCCLAQWSPSALLDDVF
jgi:hypothetical protein